MSKRYPVNQFIPLTEDDLEIILSWRNSPRVKANMNNDSKILWREHEAWYASLKKDKTREFWLLYQDNRPIGVLNFCGIGSAKVEWGCYLGETKVWPGSGVLFEVAALDHASSFYAAELLVAEVLSFNRSAIALHRLFEYPLVSSLKGGKRNGTDYERLFYEYPLSMWYEKRASLLLKLPKSLQVLAESFEFRESA